MCACLAFASSLCGLRQSLIYRYPVSYNLSQEEALTWIQQPHCAFTMALCWLWSALVFLSLSPTSKPIEEETHERGVGFFPVH